MPLFNDIGYYGIKDVATNLDNDYGYDQVGFNDIGYCEHPI